MKKENNMIGKRITSAFLALTTMVTAIPFTATAAESNNVYISISYDGKFINGKEGNAVAYSAVSLDDLAAIDLDTYGLGDYKYDKADKNYTRNNSGFHNSCHSFFVIYFLSFQWLRYNGKSFSCFCLCFFLFFFCG